METFILIIILAAAVFTILKTLLKKKSCEGSCFLKDCKKCSKCSDNKKK